MKVTGCRGSGTVSDAIECIDWVTASAGKPAIANIGLGTGLSKALDDAVTVGLAEHGLILVVFVVAAVVSMAGIYWHMRARMRPAGRGETAETARPAPAASRKHRGPTGAAARGWAYETEAAGRPRRCLSHREAAWWAARRAGVFFVPLLVYTFARALVAFDGPYPWSAVLYVAAGVVLASLATVGAVYLYLALSGGVMGKAERRRRGGEGNGGRA